jgi:hypothetical protein
MFSGTITVSTCPPPEKEEVNRTGWGMKRPVLLQRLVKPKQQPIHLFVHDQNRFSNIAEFRLKYNEEHLLMTDLMPAIRHATVEKGAPVKMDTGQPSVQLAFLVRVKPRLTVVTVGPNTSLFLLLSLDCLHVDQLLLNGAQTAQLLDPPPQ